MELLPGAPSRPPPTPAPRSPATGTSRAPHVDRRPPSRVLDAAEGRWLAGLVRRQALLLHAHAGGVCCVLLVESEGLGLEGCLLFTGGADAIRVWDPTLRDAKKACRRCAPTAARWRRSRTARPARRRRPTRRSRCGASTRAASSCSTRGSRCGRPWPTSTAGRTPWPSTSASRRRCTSATSTAPSRSARAQIFAAQFRRAIRPTPPPNPASGVPRRRPRLRARQGRQRERQPAAAVAAAAEGARARHHAADRRAAGALCRVALVRRVRRRAIRRNSSAQF